MRVTPKPTTLIRKLVALAGVLLLFWSGVPSHSEAAHHCPILSRLFRCCRGRVVQATPTIIPAHVIVIMGGVKDLKTDKEIWEHNVAQVKKWLLVTPYKSVEAQSEEKNKALIDKLVQEHEKTKFRSFRIFRGQDVTPQDIIRYVNTLPVGRDDAVFVYILAHGVVDPPKRLVWLLKGNVLEDYNRKEDFLYADDLTNTITRKNPRLMLIVSDSCGTQLDVDKWLASRMGEREVMSRIVPPGGGFAMPEIRKIAVPLWWYTRLDIVLARGAGRWHINSVAPDKKAKPTSQKEFPFTQAFVTVAQLPFAFEEQKIPNDRTDFDLELQDVEKVIRGVKKPGTLSEVVKEVALDILKEKKEITDSLVKMDASNVLGFLDQSARVAILSAWEYLKKEKEQALTQDFAEFYPWLLLAKDKDENDWSDKQKKWEELMISEQKQFIESHAGSGTEARGEKIEEGKQEKDKGVSGPGMDLGPGQGKGQQ